MLDFLKTLKNEDHDAIFFLPGPKEDSLHIESAVYKNPGEKLGGSPMGDSYHVILFKEDSKNGNEVKIYDIDKFEAILAEPLEYISTLIPQDWFGIIARRTTTSEAFIEKTFAKLTEV
jgi:hypothetical protein